MKLVIGVLNKVNGVVLLNKLKKRKLLVGLYHHTHAVRVTLLSLRIIEVHGVMKIIIGVVLTPKPKIRVIKKLKNQLKIIMTRKRIRKKNQSLLNNKLKLLQSSLWNLVFMKKSKV